MPISITKSLKVPSTVFSTLVRCPLFPANGRTPESYPLSTSKYTKITPNVLKMHLESVKGHWTFFTKIKYFVSTLFHNFFSCVKKGRSARLIKSCLCTPYYRLIAH
jgi:hypothetical protein